VARLPSLSVTSVKLKLPWVGEVEVAPDDTERRAAWSLYVELVTRVAVQALGPDHGLLREALASLYSLFGSTREVLKEAGPRVGAGRDSVGGIAIRVLNDGLRPVLAYWHPRLAAHEATRAAGAGAAEHEARWAEAGELRAALERLRGELAEYAHALGVLAGVEEPRAEEARRT
jgi:hypothetical protein